MPDLEPVWKEPYKKAMRELDKIKLSVAVMNAETSMFRRYQQIADSSGHCDERLQMAAALEDLMARKVRMLGWTPCGNTTG
jgi:Tfp pilus assembly protein PilW